MIVGHVIIFCSIDHVFVFNIGYNMRTAEIWELGDINMAASHEARNTIIRLIVKKPFFTRDVLTYSQKSTGVTNNNVSILFKCGRKVVSLGRHPQNQLSFILLIIPVLFVL